METNLNLKNKQNKDEKDNKHSKYTIEKQNNNHNNDDNNQNNDNNDNKNDNFTYKRMIKPNNCFSIANKQSISNDSEIKNSEGGFNLNLITNSSKGILKNKYPINDDNTIISPSDLKLIESNAYLRINKEIQFTLLSSYSDSCFFFRLVDYCKANSIFTDYFVLLNKKKTYEKALKNNVEFCLYGKFIISEVENIINSLGINLDDILKKNIANKKKKNEIDLNTTLRNKSFI